MNALNYFGSWASIMGGTIALFGVAEVVANVEIKDRIKKWLSNTEPDNHEDKWASQFADLFDSIFGKRHLSIKCFVRSCVASVFAVLICWIVFHNTNSSGPIISIKAVDTVLFILMISMVINVFPDYLSLLESRFMLNVLMKRDSKKAVSVILFIDIIATIAIWASSTLITVPIMLYMMDWPIDTTINNMSDLLNFWIQAVSGSWNEILNMWSDDFLGPSVAIRTLFCSTFFTSVWLWLYLIGG